MKPRKTELFLAMLRAAHARRMWYVYGRKNAMELYRHARKVWYTLKKRDSKQKAQS